MRGERATWEACGVPERIVVEKGGNKGESTWCVLFQERGKVSSLFRDGGAKGKKEANAQTTDAGGCRE